MTGNPLLALVTYRRAKQKNPNLSTTAAWKTVLLGQMIGGANAATAFVVSDRLIDREAPAVAAPQPVPGGLVRPGGLDKKVDDLKDYFDKLSKKIDDLSNHFDHNAEENARFRQALAGYVEKDSDEGRKDAFFAELEGGKQST